MIAIASLGDENVSISEGLSLLRNASWATPIPYLNRNATSTNGWILVGISLIIIADAFSLNYQESKPPNSSGVKCIRKT